MTRQTGREQRYRPRQPEHPALVRLAAFLAAVALAEGCGNGGAPTGPLPPEPARPTTITVSPATADLAALGATVQLSAQVQDQNGQAVANGSATITATSGSVAGSAMVAVAQTVSSVAVTPDTASLGALGDTVRLSAEAF